MSTVKLKIRFVVDVEYQADPSNYPEDSRTPEKMLAIDLDGAKDDPFLMMDMPGAKMEITGEVAK